jgi:DNA-binding MarR family transcriptional regulator
MNAGKNVLDIYVCTKVVFGQTGDGRVYINLVRGGELRSMEQSADKSSDIRSAVLVPETAGDEAVFILLLRLVRAIQSGMQSIDASQGLSGSQLWALWQISARPGLRVAELAEALHIQPSTASNLLDKLERRGLVRRERRDADSRVVRLFLTDAAVDVVKGIPGPMQGRLRQALQGISPPLLDGLRLGLASVLDAIGEAPRADDRDRHR